MPDDLLHYIRTRHGEDNRDPREREKETNRGYGFGSAPAPLPRFGERPGMTTVPVRTTQQPQTRRTDDYDRPPAYPVPRQDMAVENYEPPTFREIMKDLGLRILEVAIAATALSIGEEIAYFFRKRRLYPKDYYERGGR